MIKILILTLFVLTKQGFAKTYKNKKTFRASDVAIDFFGNVSPEEAKSSTINLGSIGAQFETKIKCGRLDVVGSVIEDLKQIDDQAKALAAQLANQFTNPASLALGLWCYYKPTVCSYIRDSKIDFRHAFKLEADFCSSIDNFISNQADKGKKDSYAKAFGECAGSNPTAARIRHCKKNVSGRTRNIANPLSNTLMTGGQYVLKSILIAAKSSGLYDNFLSPILGEVYLNHSGYWYRAFPKNLIRPNDVAVSFINKGRKVGCDTSNLNIIIDKNFINKPSTFDEFIQQAVQKSLTHEEVLDLNDLPKSDKNLACHALGEGLASYAVNHAKTTGISAVNAALESNDAVPEDIRKLLISKTERTFKAIHEKIIAQKIPPLKETIKNIKQLAKDYRLGNRNEAADLSSKKIHNEQKQDKCVDELSCKSR